MVPFMGADGATACHGQGPLIDGVRQWILQHPQFHGRAKGLSIELEAEGVVVRGQLPSFRLRRQLAEWLAACKDARVICRVEVVNPQGLSGCSAATRRLCALEFCWLGKIPKCVATCDVSPGRLALDGEGAVSGFRPWPNGIEAGQAAEHNSKPRPS
jgi:hypothetical protein